MTLHHVNVRTVTALPTQLALTVEQQQVLQVSIDRRVGKKDPEILIVEDQDFSCKLLASLFERLYRCHVAKNAQDALAIYIDHAPEISFLDVELPDVDGHTLAALLRKHDPQACLVMVTGNNYAKDVEIAKANKVQGFIAKPYNKLKVMSVFDSFMQRRKKA